MLNKDSDSGTKKLSVPILDKRLVAANEHILSVPVVFEQLTYFFDVDFNHEVDDGSVTIKHYLSEFTDSFITRGRSLHGQFSFINEPGDFHFEVQWRENKVEKWFWIEFTVASTKMDVQSDYRSILQKVENWDRSLVFSSKAKTLHEVAEAGKTETNEAEKWVVYFDKSLDVYEKALKRILYSPYRKMTKTPYLHRIDQVKVWSPSLTREYAQYSKDIVRLERHRFSDEIYEMTFDTAENRFVKWTLQHITSMLQSAALNIDDDAMYSVGFKQDLKKRTDRFRRYQRDAKLSRVGVFNGTPNSLVMQMRPGYVEVRKIWELMNTLFTTDLSLGGKFSMGLVKLSALYEFWCFITVKEMMDAILKQRFGIKEAQTVSIYNAIEALESAGADEDRLGVKPIAYKYNLPNGSVVAEVAFQQSYGNNANKSNGIFARPFQQRPDIVVSLHDKNQIYTYLFDAKYRIENSLFTGWKDAAPRDALDQMHRYRDAILWREHNGHNVGVKREVVGAYILYPANPAKSSLVPIYDYSSLITEQNIGAFSLLPGQTESLKNHLERLVAKLDVEAETSAWLLDEKQVIPQKGLFYTDDESGAVTDSMTLDVDVDTRIYDVFAADSCMRFPISESIIKAQSKSETTIRRLRVHIHGQAPRLLMVEYLGVSPGIKYTNNGGAFADARIYPWAKTYFNGRMVEYKIS